MSWSNRIVGHANIPPEDILAHPLNNKIHPTNQQKIMSEVLDTIGWVDTVMISNSGRLLDGHMRVILALRNHEPTVPVSYVDVTEAEENLIVSIHDYIASYAIIEPVNTESLLEELIDKNNGLFMGPGPNINKMLEDIENSLEANNRLNPGPQKPTEAEKTERYRTIRLKVNTGLYDRFRAWWSNLPGDNDNTKLEQFLTQRE
jgi:hypothetical protein